MAINRLYEGNANEVIDENENFPIVPNDLLEALISRFPDQCPSISTPERQIWIDVGKAEVVRFLKDMNQQAKH